MGMWWIAACLGALVWLLAVRIKVKEQERQVRSFERSSSSDAAERKAFLENGFVPVAEQYLSGAPETEELLLVFGHFVWDDKPAEVHMEVLPRGRVGGDWPGVAADCLGVIEEGGVLHFNPSQAHWERLKGLEEWLGRLTCFAAVCPPVLAKSATLRDYTLYARVRRRSDGKVEAEVVGEPT